MLSGFRAVAAHLSPLLGSSEEELTDTMSTLLRTQGRGRIFNEVLERHHAPPDVSVSGLVDLYRRHRPTIRFYPDVPPVLTWIRRQGLGIGIVTDGLLTMQQSKIAALGLADYADALVCTDSFGTECWKPHPLPFRFALDQLNLAPEDAIFVGDNPAKDFPRAAEPGNENSASGSRRRSGRLPGNLPPPYSRATPRVD